MKNEFSPWPAVRWMAAAAVYCLTVAIAHDMVSTRQKKIDELKSGMSEIKTVVDRLLVTTDKNIEGIESAISLMEETNRINQQSAANVAKLREAQRLLDQAEGK